MPVRGRSRRAALVVVAGLLATAACSTSSQSDTARQADSVASTAGTVMVRGIGPVPARDAAWQVVGTRSDRSIEALQADGTTYQGTVVLRITTGLDGGEGVSPVTRCYRYAFRREIDDFKPQTMASCPSRPALALASPPPPVAVTDATRSKLIAALKALTPTQQKSSAAIRAALLPKFRPPLVLMAEGPGSGVNAAISVTITNTVPDFATSCVVAYLRAGHSWQVLPVAAGVTCRGG